MASEIEKIYNPFMASVLLSTNPEEWQNYNNLETVKVFIKVPAKIKAAFDVYNNSTQESIKDSMQKIMTQAFLCALSSFAMQHSEEEGRQIIADYQKMMEDFSGSIKTAVEVIKDKVCSPDDCKECPFRELELEICDDKRTVKN
jgi:hypothetical protein